MKWYKPSEKLPEEGRLVILATKDKRTGYSEIDVDIAEASSYDVRFEMDVLSNDGKHEKVGTLTATALRVSYIAGRLEVHGRY